MPTEQVDKLFFRLGEDNMASVSELSDFLCVTVENRAVTLLN
jgi:hypothetical protein